MERNNFKKKDFAFVKLPGDIAVIGNGAGLTLTGMDMITLYGGKPATFLDIGGGASEESIKMCLDLSGNGALESYLDSYGVKLSDYERMSNLGELDSEYIILLEVPRNDVDFIINNMDNLILTIPTQFAPDWVANELSQTYYEALTAQDNETLL